MKQTADHGPSASGQLPSRQHGYTEPIGCSILAKAKVDATGVSAALSGGGAKADCVDDGDDEGPIQRSEGSLRSVLDWSTVSSDSDESSSGSDLTPGNRSNDAGSGSVERPRKSALKSPASTRRKDLHVRWAPGVYDPKPTLMSHTVGHGTKATLSTRRSRKHHHGKGKQPKSKNLKQGKDSCNQKTSRTAPPLPQRNVSLCVGEAAVQGAAILEDLGDVGTLSDGDMNATAVEQESAADIQEEPSELGTLATDTSPVQPIEKLSIPEASAATILDVSVLDQGSSRRSKEHGKRSRPRSASKSEFAQEKFFARKGPAEDVALKRSEGAAAFVAGDVESAQELLLAALETARSMKLTQEQGVCLRLLADTQTDHQKESTLSLAIEVLSSTHLALEHAEARLALAQHIVAPLLEVLCTGSQKPLGVHLNSKDISRLHVAKGHLQHAVAVLLNSQMVVPTVAMSPESPTGRRRKTKTGPSLPPRVAAASVLMGSICYTWGRVSSLLNELDEAQVQLLSATMNKLWCQSHPEMFREAGELLNCVQGMT